MILRRLESKGSVRFFALYLQFSGGGDRFDAEEADGRDGEMAERLNAAVLKTAEPSRVPWVRIPLSPPAVQSSSDGGRN